MTFNDRQMTTRIVGFGIPNVGQIDFDRELHRMTGYRLAWHCRRRVFVPYRMDTPSCQPMTHPCELSKKHWPLGRDMLRLVVDAIRMSEACSSRNMPKMMREMKRLAKDRKLEEYFRRADDMMPEIISLAQYMARTMGQVKTRRSQALVNN